MRSLYFAHLNNRKLPLIVLTVNNYFYLSKFHMSRLFCYLLIPEVRIPR